MRRVSSGAGSPAALALAAVLSAVQPLLVLVDVQFPGRTWTALAYALLVPGLAIAAWLRLPSRLASWGLALAISIATQILVAMVMLQTGHWVPIASVLVPSLISWPFLFASLRRPRALPDAHPTRKPMSARDRLAEFGLTPWLLLAALACFVHAVTHTDQNRMTAYALISVMPVTYVVSLGFIGAAAGLELVRLRQRQGWLGAVTVTLVVVLFTYQNGSDSVAGFPTSWLHVGYTDYIRTHGAILPNFDARFSWPGFFAATANLSVSAGLPDATGLLRWAPLLYNLLLIIPLLLLARRIGRNRVYAWFAVMLCFLGNWFEQDYFSPQATNLVLYLVVLSVLVWLGRAATSPVEVRVRGRIARWWHDGLRLSTARLARAIAVVRPPRAPGVDAHQYVAIGVILVLVIAASVVSHQLTPVVTVLAVSVLAFSARTRLRFLWLAGGLVFALWFSYGATDFWLGHLAGMVGDLGQVGSTIGSGVGRRVVGSPEHLKLQYLRLATSGGFLILACIGLVVRRRSPWLPALIGLAFVPFSLIAGQSYGGEVVVRCFLFAMPLFAVLSTDVLAILAERLPTLVRAVAIALVLTVAGTALVATRGANQRYERATPDQIASVNALYAAARNGSTIGEFSSFNTLHLGGIGRFTYPGMSDPTCFTVDDPAGCITNLKPDYVYFSSGQTFYGTDVVGLDPTWAATAAGRAITRDGYRIVWQSDHALILASPTSRGGLS